MNCQHCQAELTNPRAKNCKTCSDILNQANRAGSYGFVMEAAAQAKADGLTGNDVHDAMRSAMALGSAKRAEWSAEYRARKEQRGAERVAEQARRNAFYTAHSHWPQADQQDDLDLNRDAQEQAEVNRRNAGRVMVDDEDRGIVR